MILKKNGLVQILNAEKKLYDKKQANSNIIFLFTYTLYIYRVLS